MAGTTYSLFYWADWRSDPELRMCSIGARGLWMDLLSLMAESDPPGFLLVSGKRPGRKEIARVAGVTVEEAERLFRELEANKVFSRDSRGVVFCRRMVRDHKKRVALQKGGKKGGETSVSKRKGIFRGFEPRAEPQPSLGSHPLTISQSPVSSGPIGPAAPGQSKEPRAANVVPISNAYRTDLPETNTGLEPIHLKEILFTRALKWIEKKAPERTVHRHRAWVGHLIKEFGELITIDAFRRAQQTAAVDPVSFIEGCCRHAKATGGVPGARREADPLAIAGIKQGG